MTQIVVPLGELCLQTPDARTQADVSVAAKATDTESAAFMSATVRFWRRVNKDGPTNTRRPELGPCWLWTGSHGEDKHGQPTYGQIMVASKRMGAHRFSFLLHGGTVPDGLEIMHACDTKLCCRPSHLSAGTRSQNLLDGFAAPANQGVCAGENNGRARLTWTDVHAIRAARAAGATQPDLARRYGVSQVQIHHIERGKRWPESKCPVHASVEAAA